MIHGFLRSTRYAFEIFPVKGGLDTGHFATSSGNEKGSMLAQVGAEHCVGTESGSQSIAHIVYYDCPPGAG
jgi:hypothetical protein